MDPLSYNLEAWGAVIFVSVLCFHLHSILTWRHRSHGRPLPPGPSSLPFLGNLFNVPKSRIWIGYEELCARYGGIVHVRVLGQSIVVLGDADIIMEYLDKRSANTSDRKQTPMIELSGSSPNMVLMPYGQWWRRHKRAFWQHFNPNAVATYLPTQRDTAREFAKLLLVNPSDVNAHIKYTFAASVLQVVYGLRASGGGEKYIVAANEALVGPREGLVPGKFLVDYLPFLRHIPTWFPGAVSQRLFKTWQDASQRLKALTYDDAKTALDESPRGPQADVVVAKLIAKIAESGGLNDVRTQLEEEDIAKNIGFIAFLAGTDTTYATLQFIFLAVSLHPDVLMKAQAELDSVVGRDRLPDFDDEDSLVYIQALIKEGLRWQPILPFSIPHCTVSDDELHGYFIPEGTVLLPNIWAIMRDPNAYENPEEFRPERFIKNGKMDTSVRDPNQYVFGFGRRICPGRYYAQAALFINVATILHTFNITPPLDNKGSPIKITPAMTDGLVGHPEDGRCTIKPRGPWAEALIRAHAQDARVTDIP